MGYISECNYAALEAAALKPDASQEGINDLGEWFSHFGRRGIGKKFYKILPKDLAPFGFRYQIGINRMEHPELLGETLVSGDESYEAGLYFADAENILAYGHYGDYIATVAIADDANLEIWGSGTYSTDVLEIVNIRPLWDVGTLKELEQEGVNLSAGKNSLLSWAKEFQKWDVVEFLKERC